MAGNDYGSQLRSALENARSTVLLEHQQSHALRQQTAVTLGHAEQVLSVDDAKLDSAVEALTRANDLFRLASQGGVIVKNATDLAASASQDVTDATNAMSTAATSIKALADAFDVLVSQVAGVSAIAHDDDANTAVDRTASLAQAITASAANTTEQLKNASLDASIESARSSAAPASQAIQTVATELQGVADNATALVLSTAQRVDLRRKADVKALQTEKAALEKYHSARGDEESLTAVLEDINLVVNGDLQVTAKATLGGTQDTAPRLEVSFQVSPPLPPPLNVPPRLKLNLSYATATEYCIFFAVPTEDSAAFSFDMAMKLILDVEEGMPNDPPRFVKKEVPAPSKPTDGDSSKASASPTPLVVNATLLADTNGKLLEVGKAYNVFVLRQPKRGLLAARASDLSLPSLPTTLTYSTLDGLNTPPPIKVDLIRNGRPDRQHRLPLFRVSITSNEQLLRTVARYRFIVLREDVFRAIKDDSLQFANLLNQAFYKEDPTPPKNSKSPTYSYTFTDADTDAFGDTFSPGDHYRALVLLVGGTGQNMSSTPANTPNALLGGDGSSTVFQCPTITAHPQAQAASPQQSSPPEQGPGPQTPTAPPVPQS